ncbi:MAG: hypothetical protein RBT69_06215 [Spirochaetia bacterium]|nr:hypothetical protein [Spirochaetia bacterium]
MTLEEYAENLEKCMTGQLELFRDFYASEERIKQQIILKNWPELDRELIEIQNYAEKIDKAETERAKIYQAMKLYCSDDQTESFYVFVSQYCPEKSAVLASLYRDLKISVMKVKTLTMRIDAYLSTVTTAVRKVLDEAFPLRKGTIYDNKGVNMRVSEPPFILDRQL